MRALFQIGVGGLIAAVGGAIAAGLVLSRDSAARSDNDIEAVLVEVVEVAPSPEVAIVEGTGTVKPDQLVMLTPLVAGPITWTSPELVPGGRFAKGDTLVRVDRRDYEYVLAQERSRVAQVELELQIERSRQSVAEKEWELLGDGRDPAEAPLALRKPQLATVEASLAAAEAGLAKAERDLYRTSVRAPFDAVVLTESVDVGQVVSSASQVATLAGTERLRVEVSLPVQSLALIELADSEGQGGSTVTVSQSLTPAQSIERQGRVLRLAGELDAQTRTAKVIVLVDDPFGDEAGGLPLLPGAFVDVRIEGRTDAQTIKLPRDAVHDGDVVWVVGEGDLLSRRTVRTGWGDRDTIAIASGLAAGDRVVVSPLATPIEGTPVAFGGGEG